MKELIAKIKAFSGEQTPKRHRVSIAEDGTVRVWDTIAGYFTTCYGLSGRQQTRLRKLAAVGGVR